MKMQTATREQVRAIEGALQEHNPAAAEVLTSEGVDAIVGALAGLAAVHAAQVHVTARAPGLLRKVLEVTVVEEDPSLTPRLRRVVDEALAMIGTKNAIKEAVSASDALRLAAGRAREAVLAGDYRAAREALGSAQEDARWARECLVELATKQKHEGR